MHGLFAQFPQPGGQGGAAGNPFADPAFLAILLVAIGIGVAIGLAIMIFFLLTLSKALKRCRPENRTMEPGMVWLNLIPVFSTFWIFLTVNRIADSLRNEFTSRRMDERDETYGRTVGMAYALCGLVNLGFSVLNIVLTVGGNPVPAIGCITMPTGLVAFVCWIAYWVKIAGYSRELAEADLDEEDDDRPRRRRPRREEDEGDDEEDDRPRRRPRDDDQDEDDRPRRKPWEK
jgi:protein-S-isoprenylcysteine O-methyltransferase Ste14